MEQVPCSIPGSKQHWKSFSLDLASTKTFVTSAYVAVLVTTPHACARGKVIGRVVVIVVVVSTKITKSQKVGVGQSALCHQWKVTKNYHLFASNHLEQLMSTTNVRFHQPCLSDHTYQCHVMFPLRMLDLPMPCGVSIAHARSQIGKGRRVTSQ